MITALCVLFSFAIIAVVFSAVIGIFAILLKIFGAIIIGIFVLGSGLLIPALAIYGLYKLICHLGRD